LLQDIGTPRARRDEPHRSNGHRGASAERGGASWVCGVQGRGVLEPGIRSALAEPLHRAEGAEGEGASCARPSEDPARVVLDSLSEIRLLSQSTLRYRRQVLALKEFFANRNITAFFLDDRTAEINDLQLHSVPHGVVVLERLAPMYCAPRRRLEVVKVRGVNYRGGFHDFSIVTGGIVVFRRPPLTAHRKDAVAGQITSGLGEMDALTGGGLRRGNSTLIMGPAGVGKSTLATQYAVAAAARGERVAMFVFDESIGTLFQRSEDLGMPLSRLVDEERISVQQVEPAELAPGELGCLVRDAVEQSGVKVVIIDSLNGYLNAMPEERFLTLHLHELLSFLGERGVTTILVMAQHGLIGAGMTSSVDVSYLADCVILLRYYESNAKIQKAISVLKKRSGPHEKWIRDYDMGSSRRDPTSRSWTGRSGSRR